MDIDRLPTKTEQMVGILGALIIVFVFGLFSYASINMLIEKPEMRTIHWFIAIVVSLSIFFGSLNLLGRFIFKEPEKPTKKGLKIAYFMINIMIILMVIIIIIRLGNSAT